MSTTPTYYPIDEEAARRAQASYSFTDYIPGSATEKYHQAVYKAALIADRQKAAVDPKLSCFCALSIPVSTHSQRYAQQHALLDHQITAGLSYDQ